MLDRLPVIEQVDMGRVSRLPDWYPESVGSPFTVFGFVIHHPVGPILVDAGIGSGNPVIDEIYAPVTIDVVGTVTAGAEPVQALVLTHLHFDHCGQSRRFRAPTYVQRAEMEAARAPRYTVPDWIPDGDVRLIDGDVDIADGVRLLATPGHTPGHQSVLVSAADGAALVLGQVCYRAGDFDAAAPIPDCDDEFRETALASLARVRSIVPKPCTVYFSHDSETVVLS